MNFLTAINTNPLPVAQGNYAEAGPLYLRSLAILEKALGPEHPSVATLLANLAELLESQVRNIVVICQEHFSENTN